MFLNHTFLVPQLENVGPAGSTLPPCGSHRTAPGTLLSTPSFITNTFLSLKPAPCHSIDITGYMSEFYLSDALCKSRVRQSDVLTRMGPMGLSLCGGTQLALLIIL